MRAQVNVTQQQSIGRHALTKTNCRLAIILHVVAMQPATAQLSKYLLHVATGSPVLTIRASCNMCSTDQVSIHRAPC